MTDGGGLGTIGKIRAEVRGVLRDGYYAVEKSLHPLRRRIAERELRSRVFRSVLFVCHGNVCRSPYAEYVFKRLMTSARRHAVEVQSAGFIGPDRSSPPEALAAALRRGYDMIPHRSRLIASSDLRSADLVVVMSGVQARDYRSQFSATSTILVLGDLDPQNTERRTVEDPWNQASGVFDASYARIDRCVGRLVEIITEGAG